MPNLSARMVPLLETFCHRHLRSAAATDTIAAQ